MPTFKVAHLCEQGQNVLLFPLDKSFGYKAPADQHSILEELEDRAHASGLAGSAAAFWESGGRTHFLGPKPWQSFLRSISIRNVLANVNKSISW